MPPLQIRWVGMGLKMQEHGRVKLGIARELERIYTATPVSKTTLVTVQLY